MLIDFMNGFTPMGFLMDSPPVGFVCSARLCVCCGSGGYYDSWGGGWRTACIGFSDSSYGGVGSWNHYSFVCGI